MELLTQFFDLQQLGQGITALAASTPFPGESEIRDAFSHSRLNQNFPEVTSRRYPEIPSMEAFRTKMCDLRATPAVWVEFKHGTSLRYIQELGFEDAQGTTKDLFRNACMDLAKTSLINQSHELTGLVVISILHLNESQDIAFKRANVELDALGTVFRITPERLDFPYTTRQEERSADGILSIFIFGRARP